MLISIINVRNKLFISEVRIIPKTRIVLNGFLIKIFSLLSNHDDDTANRNSFSGDLSNVNSNDGGVDQELQDFLMLEKQKAQLNAQIHEFSDHCWEKCITDKPKSKLDNRTETCLNNCVDRFIDVSLFITNRFAMSLQKGAKM